MTNTVIVAYIDTICNPYGKHICINTIWVPYDIAIGVVEAGTCSHGAASSSCQATSDDVQTQLD